MKRTAVFRFDASAAIGGGHAYRCLTLARELAQGGWEIVVAARGETFSVVPAAAEFDAVLLDGGLGSEARAIEAVVGSAELLVVDHYERDARFEQTARAWARRILVIDDLADRRHDCDLLLDQTYGRVVEDYARLVPGPCRLLLGAEYALLRPQFAEARDRAVASRQSGSVGHILVTMGATDPDNLTGRVLQGIAGSGVNVTADVVLAKAAPWLGAVRRQAASMKGVQVLTEVDDMADLMSKADLAVGAAGTTSWERCCLGLPALVITTAENQRVISRNLGAAGAVRLLGWHEDVQADAIGIAVAVLAKDQAAMRAMAAAAALVCDGLGVKRVAAEIDQ